MTVLLEKETDISFEIEYEQIAEEIIRAALDYVSCPYECEVNILLTDNNGIQETNKDMRNIDAPTDVLSFPMIDFQSEGDFSLVEDDISLFNILINILMELFFSLFTKLGISTVVTPAPIKL